MADNTLTSGPAYSAGVVPKAIHAGTVTVPFSWDAGGQTVSASIVVQLAKLPKNAVVTDIKVAGWIGGDAGGTIDLGTNSDVSAFATAKTISATATVQLTMNPGAVPYKVSISDDAGVDFRYFQAKFVAVTSATVTAILKGVISYVLDSDIKS